MDQNKKDYIVEVLKSLSNLSLSTKAICGSVAAPRVCIICRISIQKQCEDCETQFTSGSQTRKECPRVTGVCEYDYHLHCITHWLRDRKLSLVDLCKWRHSN